ncbi:tRNA lysidine(34) synthetase [Xanthomonas cerealis]|nr:hypothetical protein [Xanthomonas translucens]UKE47455.1 hypothetical protein KHA79_01590 [Xanthomonas translucens pv. cerealis]
MEKILFHSAHGDFYLEFETSDSVDSICKRFGLPISQVSTYVKVAHDEEYQLFVDPFSPLSSYGSAAEFMIVPNRNIDYRAMLGRRSMATPRAGASTWMQVEAVDGVGKAEVKGVFLTPEECVSIVDANVKQALLDCGIQPDEILIVGVSGGGDSNALLGALVRSEVVPVENIRPVMMLGIPDWDRGKERAQAICGAHGLDVRFFTPQETASAIGFRDSEKDWVTAFEKTFPGDDLEVLGVYGVRKVLEAAALEVGATKILIGANLEDCLSSALYYACNGKSAFPAPVAKIGEVEVVHPLWLTPKGVIDGCFPKFSRENYENRYPSIMQGRAYFYYMAQMIHDSYPGAAQKLLKGLSSLARDYYVPAAKDPDFNFHPAEAVPLELRHKLTKLFISKSN